ncbi:MAG: sigma-70 family RNA polymerase sigma factor [bacterium]
MQDTLEQGEIKKHSNQVEDSETIRRCQYGDKRAFGLLVQKYMKQAYFTALGFTGAHEAALDLSQEAFVKAWRAIKRFETGRNFFTWYYRILRNLCFNHLRDSAHKPRSFSEIGENAIAEIADTHADPVQESEANELKEMVWKGLNRLRVHEREIIILKDLQEMSYKEIAEILQCPIGTVMSRLYTARKALKSELEGIFVL